jgi:L-malate glycosyltransferase
MAAQKVVFAWENLGPSHFDRLRACQADPELEPIAIELFAASAVYDWDGADLAGIRRHTLLPERAGWHSPKLFWQLLRTIRRERPDAVFLCHYNEVGVFLATLILRLCGVPVFTMADSKFDDMPRGIRREMLKAVMLVPYCGALVGSRRSAEYLGFLGLRKRPIALGFDSLDVAALKALAPAKRRPLPHAKRDFLIVARLVEKKNLGFAIRAFAQWHSAAAHDRTLRLVGYGEHGDELRALAAELGIADRVVFEGRLESRAVIAAMRDALCLILPSTEEQFGLVVIEALAAGLPVLVSSNAGAVDGLIDSGVNGWVIDPYRPEALVAAMTLLDRDEAAWQAASAAALGSAGRGDVVHFVSGVKALLQAR